jgi:cell division protein FtsI (penicillin-binding protein 3)
VAKKTVKHVIPRWRYYLVMSILGSLPVILGVKIAQLQIMPSEEHGRDFLQDQGDARSIRKETIPAHRGLITDRNGEPLAVSTPVTTLIANPQQIQKSASASDVERLAVALDIPLSQLQGRLKRYRNKSFMYLARQ